MQIEVVDVVRNCIVEMKCSQLLARGQGFLHLRGRYHSPAVDTYDLFLLNAELITVFAFLVQDSDGSGSEVSDSKVSTSDISASSGSGSFLFFRKSQLNLFSRLPSSC